jgi:hypothetical protein
MVQPMTRLRSLTLALLALLAAAGPAAAQGGVEVSLTIRAEDGGEPVAGAQVEVMGTRRVATAGSDGVARLRVPEGPALFEVRKLGYGTERFSLNLPATDTLGIDVALAVAPVRLRGVEATATATQAALRDAGFYDRQRTGIGVFLTGRDIARHPGARLLDAFRRVPGVRVVRDLSGSGPGEGSSRSSMEIDELYRLATTRGSTTILGPPNCWLEIYMDDMPVGAEALSTLPVSEVVAIEVYRGAAETPGKYRTTSNGCGAVVLWTKRGRAG